MTSIQVQAPYTLKQVHQLIGLGPHVVRALVDKGFVIPSHGERNQLRFTFQDLLLLKTAQALKRARIPTRRILESLTSLRADLPSEMPLTGLRITAAGSSVAVRDAGQLREAATGQLVLDFEVTISNEQIVLVADRSLPAAAETDWFALGESLEETAPVDAEQAYRRAIAQDPYDVDAVVNLGAMLCESGRCSEAVSLFDGALAAGTENALLYFNHGIALEDIGQVTRAIEAYSAALKADPSFADAHYNIALLLEQVGDEQGALRHLSAYRRLNPA